MNDTTMRQEQSDVHGDGRGLDAEWTAERPVRRLHRLPAECYSETGREFLFTMCARHLGEPFREPAIAQSVVDCLLWRHSRKLWHLVCYCLMPDHLHFIARTAERSSGSSMNAGARGTIVSGVLEQVARFKSFTTTQVWWKQGGEGVLCQKSSHDRLVHDPNVLSLAADYVLHNPVRAALVAHWQDYPYAGLLERVR